MSNAWTADIIPHGRGGCDGSPSDSASKGSSQVIIMLNKIARGKMLMSAAVVDVKQSLGDIQKLTRLSVSHISIISSISHSSKATVHMLTCARHMFCLSLEPPSFIHFFAWAVYFSLRGKQWGSLVYIYLVYTSIFTGYIFVYIYIYLRKNSLKVLVEEMTICT